MQAPADLGPIYPAIYTVRFLSHATSARQAYDMSYDCRSILKHVLKCMRQKSYRVSRPFESFYNVLYTLPLFVRRHRLLERGIHTFAFRHGLLERGVHTSPVCFSAQAFRTRDTHFPLFVCRRRLRGIHTFTFRHRLLERGVHTFRSSPVSSSAQAFRTRHKHFPMFVC